LTLEKLKFEFSKNQFHTQNKTGVSITKSKMLMLYRDIITVYYGKYEVHIVQATCKSGVQVDGICGNQQLSRSSMGFELSHVMDFLRIMHPI
jgi:hypothetical protein